MLTVPYVGSCLLLIAAGVGKLRGPANTGALLKLVHLPGTPAVVRVIAGGEVLVGSAGFLLFESWLAAVLAAAYASFTVIIAYLLARGHHEVSCGCFGSSPTPLSRLHLFINTILAGACCAAVFSSTRAVPDLLDSGVRGWMSLVAAVVSAWALYLIMVRLPEVGLLAEKAGAPAGSGDGRPSQFAFNGPGASVAPAGG